MKRAFLIRLLWQWHRRIGVVACILVLILSITGILANHSSRMGFDRTPLSVQWILSSYGFDAPDTYQGVDVEGHLWIASATQLFRDDVLVSRCTTDWHSVNRVTEIVVASCGTKIELFTEQGDSIEVISALPQRNLIKSGFVKGN